MKNINFGLLDREKHYKSLSQLRKFSIHIFFICSLIYMELIFHLVQFHSFDFRVFYKVLFVIPAGLASGIFATLSYKEKTNRIVTFIILFIWTFLFGVQIVYNAIFKNYLAPFSLLNVAGQAFDFLPIISSAILSCSFPLLLISLPLFLLISLFYKSLYFG